MIWSPATTFTRTSRPDLARIFSIPFSADVDSLFLYAGSHRVVYGSHRALAARFPYAIYYRVEADVVRVRAIIDCRRSPRWIRRRLRNA